MADRITDTDTELIHRVRDGDKVALRTLVDLYKDKALSLAVSIVKDKPLAEDMLQDVFIKVHKNIGTFKFKSKFSTWLYKIVVNTCYTELKKKKHTVSIEDEELTFQKMGSFERNHILTLEDQKTYIQKAMNRLKPDEAVVLRLFYLCEMSLKEVEEITKSSPSKIRVDLHRGRKNLEQELKLLLGEEIAQLL